MTTVRRSIPRTPTPLSADVRLFRAQRQADLATAAAAVVAADVAVVDAKAEAAQDDADQALLDAANAQTDADTVQATIDDVLTPQAVSLAQSVQGAQSAGNATQSQVDVLSATGTVSGSATNPAIDLFSDSVWVEGPQVDLTSVVAGNLTITGSGPLQDSDVALFFSGFAVGEYRIVEDIGGTDTVLFTGSFAVTTGTPAVVINADTEDVANFTSARTSTGAVSYRIDARIISGPAVTSLSLYVFARRAS
jgi:hypothetical protein